MSAFICNPIHIDALLTAGFHWNEYGALRWYVPEPPDETDYQRGQPWGPTAVAHARQTARELTSETVDTVRLMLVSQNYASVNYRYDENELAGIGTFQRLPGIPDPVIILKAISCYEYQSCETPDWKDTEAQAFCEALRRVAISHLPGYDDAEAWEITRQYVFASMPRGKRKEG